MNILTVETSKEWMQKIKQKMQENQEQLNALDEAIGDGDHGNHMVYGFQEVVGKINHIRYDHPAEVFKTAAMTLFAKAGVAGRLYGTAFLEMSMVLEGENVDHSTFQKAIQQAVKGIESEGEVEFGDKTLYDVWYQVSDFLIEVSPKDWAQLSEVCQATIEDTRELIAQKGKASTWKEHSIGFVDPGSMSTFYIFEAFVEILDREVI